MRHTKLNGAKWKAGGTYLLVCRNTENRSAFFPLISPSVAATVLPRNTIAYLNRVAGRLSSKILAKRSFLSPSSQAPVMESAGAFLRIEGE